jgi:ABC-type glycerol-3-phosphate transport system substrate-binding protein
MVDLCSCELPGYGDVTGFKWDVAAMPKGPKRAFNFLNVDVGSLIRQGKDHETAWDVLRFMTLDEPNASHLQVDSYGAIPARIESLPAFKEGLAGRFPGINVQVFLDAIPHAGGDNEDWIPNYAQVRTLQNAAFDRILKGEATADDELPRLQAAAQKAIDEWLARGGRGS